MTENNHMNVPEMLKSLGEQVQANASGKTVYGEPVSLGDKTVIPVARVRYGFGGGGGGSIHEASSGRGSGGGGGGHVSASPAGIVEITPSATRFIPIPNWKTTLTLISVSLALGFLAGKRRTR